MAPKVARKKPPTRGKVVPTASLRKRLNDEREDLSHSNYNNPPRIPAKRVKTCSTRVPVRDSSISGSVSRVSVTPEEDSSQDSSAVESSSYDSQGTPTTQSSTDFFVEHEKFSFAEVPQPKNSHNATLEQQRITTTEEEVLPKDRNSEQGAGEYCPRDPSLLTSFATHQAKVLDLGQDLGCLRVYHHSPTWELGEEIERVQNIVNLWGLGRIGAISYKHYNVALIIAFCERWHPETNIFHFKWGEMTITLEDVSRLIGLRVDGDLTVVEGKWGAAAVKEIFRKSMYLPDRVYPNLKVGGQGISLSLKKIVDFFVGKVGTNAPQAASSSSSPIKLSSRMDKDVNKSWSWGAATLAHLYYSLGASSRVNVKGLACCTTLLESWIFEHFPKLPSIPTPNQSGAAEFCTRWSWTKTTSTQSGSAALNMFREALNSYKLQDVVWDPYLEKIEDKHNFKEVASFTGLLCSPEHNKPYYPDRVQRQFNRRQPVPRAPTCVEQSSLRLGDKPCAYKPKYNWVDLFSKGEWRDSIILTRGRKVHDGIPVCSEGYFEWFNSFSFTKLCLDVVNLAEDDDYDDGKVLGDRGGVSQRENVEVPHSQNEGGGGPTEVVEDPARSVLVEALAAKTRECAFLMEANLRMQADIQAKDVANFICEKKLNEKLFTLECESKKKMIEDLQMQLADKVKKCETLSSINNKLMEEVYVNQEAQPLPLNLVPHLEENDQLEAEKWKHKYDELNAKFEEAQRRLSEGDRNGVWQLALKGAIEGGDFKDTEDSTYEELSKQFTKLLTIAQEGPKGEYEDDIILSGRGEYQERIDSRLKKIDHKTNLRQTLF
ncbi:hypothetical protein GIB67_018922 [Kingdonia uniflora]|uniref:Aminotransferase-like plant mobile domain-containing protein n=1 Tax=Kingdonia uniflora TaxID=39325 RepID=A0A7J7L2R8_9MAGN|nr:hypothetical protein GIB67_018922 [Kingdonia uniflora]